MNNTDTLTIHTWRDIKDTIIKLNPFIGNSINQVSGVDNFPVITIRYPFGATIVNRGKFHVQLEQDNIPLSDDNTPSELKDLLDYHWQVMPFGMMLENSIETYHDFPSHIIPYRLYDPGRTFSLLSIFNNNGCSHLLPHSYSSIAGCRSLITLPQLAHKQYHQRLSKRLELDTLYIAKNFAEQWPLLKAMSNSEHFTYPWHAKMVFFSKDFISTMNNHPELKNKLLQSIWQSTAFARNQGMYDLVWSSFIESHLPLAIKNNLIVMETVRYLLNVLMQARPAYVPVVDNLAGPVHGFSKMLLDVYRIRFYLPAFMKIAHYDGQTPIYYSLQKPCFVSAMSHKSSDSQTIKMLKQIKETFELFKACVLDDSLPFSLQNTLLHQKLQDTNLTFYHPKGGDELCQDIDSLFKEDPRFDDIKKTYCHYQQLSLPDSSMFFHGCIRLAPNN